MKIKSIILAMLSSTALLSSLVNAAPVTINGGTVNFKGDFVNAGCAVSTDTENQTVLLGQYRAADLKAVGQTTTNIPFSIKLVGCNTVETQGAQFSFNGVADETNSELLSLTASNNNISTATGVGVEILDRSGSALKPDGSSFSTLENLLEGTNVIHFNARYKATAAAVTAGKADSSATFVIKYQ